MQPTSPSSLGSLMQSLITGRLDHGSLLRMPNLHGRPFWIGAAMGAGLVMYLRSRSQGSTGANGGAEPPPPTAS